MKKALITGITGQDGAYLARFLINKGYKVYGTYRRTSNINFWRIEELNIKENLTLLECDLTDLASIIKAIKDSEPDEIYNLAAQSFVGTSFKEPYSTSLITGLGCLNVLDGIRLINSNIKFYQASTSEMFGMVQEIPQRETTSFYPRSPYGVAKLFAHWMTVNYRESYGIFASSGILFNHESPLRGLEFVTRKITDSVAKIKLGLIDSFELGNLDASRDWGYAEDFVEAMWLMLQAKKPDTFIVSTNKSFSVRDFLVLAFKLVDINLIFKKEGKNEFGINSLTGKKVVIVSSKLFRPSEVDTLIGSYDKAKEKLGWEPKIFAEELCQIMIEADLIRNSK